MKRILRRLLNGVLSIITTMLIMASPVAVIMYAAEPAALAESYTADMVAAFVDEEQENHLNRLAREFDTFFAYQEPEVRDLASAEHKNAETVYTYLSTEEQDNR